MKRRPSMALDSPVVNLAISSSMHFFKAMVGLVRSPTSTLREEEAIGNKQQGRGKEERVNRGEGFVF